MGLRQQVSEGVLDSLVQFGRFFVRPEVRWWIAVHVERPMDERSNACHDALDRRRRHMTRLGSIIEERDITYAALAARAHLQARTVRLLATGETPLHNVAVGTIRRIASALAVPVAELLVDAPVYPGDGTRPRTERLSAAGPEVMWPDRAIPYPSPVEAGGRDEIVDVTPDEFFDGMPAIDARRG